MLLKELSRTVPGVDDRVRELGEGSAAVEYEGVADRLWTVFLIARELAPPRPRTGCDLHPEGPVDPLAPDGWSRCLLCNRNRRISNPSVPDAGEGSGPGHAEATPAYGHRDLAETMRLVTELRLDLGHDSSDEAFEVLAEQVHRAFVIARELSRPRGGAGCSRHPGAPVDPAAVETGGTACLFCRGEEWRRSRQGPSVPRGRRPRPRRRFGYRLAPPPGRADGDPGSVG